MSRACAPGAQFTCFTSAMVQILTQARAGASGAQFSCFTSALVQILTQARAGASVGRGGGSGAEWARGGGEGVAGARAAAGGELAGTQFACFTSTKVQILTRNRGAGGGEGVAGARAAVGGGARGELAGALYLLYWYSLLALLEERVGRFGGGARRCALLALLSLLALLVQRYKGVAGARAAVGGGARGELAGARVYLLY